MKKLLIAIMVLTAFSSCSNYYYKAITTSEPNRSGSIENLKSSNRYFILRDGNQAFGMSNISFTADQKTMQCTLEDLPGDHKLHLTNGINGKMKYSNQSDQDEPMVLNEVHVYKAPGGNLVTGPYSIALNRVQKIEVIEKDKVKTRKSRAIGIGIGVGAAVLVVGVAAYIVVSSSLSTFHL